MRENKKISWNKLSNIHHKNHHMILHNYRNHLLRSQFYLDAS